MQRPWCDEQRTTDNEQLHGFTLIELLVSVSIISILAAVLIPAIMQARSATRRTVCQNSLRQWALAVRMYADANHGRLPYRGQGVQPTTRLDAPDDWINAIPTFAESPSYVELVSAKAQPKPGDATIWMCPDAEPLDPGDPLHRLPPKPFDEKTFFAYGMNMALSTPYMGRPDNINKIGELQTLVFMADGLGPYCSVIPHKNDYSPIARHIGNTVNIAFMDGRVEAYAGDEVGCRIGDTERPDIRWWPPHSKWPGPPE
jgi:prepilin-type N-terminal cleavage/methylation domain-containing protein/prepilin-type processing-associated H-X9-DG protein